MQKNPVVAPASGSNTLPQYLQFTSAQWDQMRSQAEELAPVECCGLLLGEKVGIRYHTIQVVPAKNTLNSQTGFQMDPAEQLQIFQEMDSRNLILVGIYHSHPNGPATPSATDIQQAYYPETVTLIWSKISADWQCRGYFIRGGQILDVPVEIVPSSVSE